MGVVDRETLTTALHALDREAFVAFVADLLTARGYDVEIEGEYCIARDGSNTRVVFVRQPSRFAIATPKPDRPVDLVVTSRFDDGGAERIAGDHGTVLDPAGVRRWLVYSINRASAEALTETHLGVAFSKPARANPAIDTRNWRATPRGLVRALGGVGERVGRLVGRAPWVADHGGRAAVAVAIGAMVVVSLVGAGALGGIGGGGGDDITSGAAGGGSVDDSGESSVTAAPPAPVTGPRLEQTNERLRSLPFGLDGSGISNAERLAYVHERSLTNRSYRWVVTYEEFAGNRSVGTAREVVTVQGETTYTVASERQGDLARDPVLFAGRPAYATGEHRYVPVRVSGSGSDRRAVDIGPGDPRFAGRAGNYIEWFLTAPRSAITDVRDGSDRTFYRVGTLGNPYPGMENARTNATIDSRGIVHSLRAQWTTPDSERRVVLTYRYADIGTATVSPPEWYTDSDPEEGDRNAAFGR